MLLRRVVLRAVRLGRSEAACSFPAPVAAATVVGEWLGALQKGRSARWDWRMQRVGGAAPLTPPSQPEGLDKREDKTVAGEGGEQGLAAGAETASSSTPPVRVEEGLSGTKNKLSVVDAAREALVTGTPTAQVLLQVTRAFANKMEEQDRRMEEQDREISTWSAWTRMLLASTWWPIFEGELRHTALDDMGARTATYLRGGVWFDEDTKEVLQERGDGLTRLRLTTAGLYDRKRKILRSPTVLATCMDLDTDKGRAFLAATRFTTRRIPVNGWSSDKGIPLHIVDRPHLDYNFGDRVDAAHPFLHALKTSASAPEAMLEVINTTLNFKDKATAIVSPVSEKLVYAVIDEAVRVCRATGDHVAAANYALVRQRIVDLVVLVRDPIASDQSRA